MSGQSLTLDGIFISAFFFRKKRYINFVPKSVHRPSVSMCVRFLVIVSPHKLLAVATSNFVAA